MKRGVDVELKAWAGIGVEAELRTTAIRSNSIGFGSKPLGFRLSTSMVKLGPMWVCLDLCEGKRPTLEKRPIGELKPTIGFWFDIGFGLGFRVLVEKRRGV